MEIKIDLTLNDVARVMKLALAGCTELLDYPELCTLINKEWADERGYDFDRNCYWYKLATPVHALAFTGNTEILDYPQYLKLKNESGDTPLHFLTEYFLPSWSEKPVVTPEISEIFDRILQIEGLDKLEGFEKVTPLHNIAKMGYISVLDYPRVELVETKEWNAHGTPMTFLYNSATDGLERLLKHPHIFTDYKHHGSPLESLARNKELRPNVGVLKKYGFKFNRKWHPSKKLDREVVSDMLSVPKSIRFMLY